MVNTATFCLNVGRKIRSQITEKNPISLAISRIMDETTPLPRARTRSSGVAKRGKDRVVGSENDDGGGNGRERNKGWERRMGFVAGEVSVGSLKPLIAF